MPAKNTQRIDGEGVCSHIFNRGVTNRIIFNDSEDYRMFLAYLHEYLMPPLNSSELKKTFTVRGHTFKGLPHQSKNYYGKVELLSYSLRPNHFHLLMHQKNQDALQKFIRSLCTRYAIYFNKKYQCTGPLFAGPYKSIQIKSSQDLLYLTHFFHSNPGATHQDLIEGYSSYAEYLGVRNTLWVKPKLVISYFNLAENLAFRGTLGYQNFVEKYQLDTKVKQLLEKIILENASEHLERRSPLLERHTPVEKPEIVGQKSQFRIPEFAAATAVFILLLALGLQNINAASFQIITPLATPVPQVAGIQIEKLFQRSSRMQITKITAGLPYVIIHRNPVSGSSKIGEAEIGDSFEFISINSEWYEVKLTAGSTGFIAAKYIEM